MTIHCFRTVHCIYYNPGSEKAVTIARRGQENGLKCVEVSRSGLDTLCREVDRYKGRHVHQGIVADVSRLHYYPLDYRVPQLSLTPSPHDKGDHISSASPVWVLLCSVRDPGNLGSIVRTCYYLGVTRLVVTGARCQLSSVVSKASSGTLECVNVWAARDAVTMINDKLEQGWRVLAADIPDYYTNMEENDLEEADTVISDDNVINAVSVDSVTPSERATLLVLGSEGSGIPSDILSIVQERIYVPSSPLVHPSVDSLNVSVAAGIIIHKLCQHLRNKPHKTYQP